MYFILALNSEGCHIRMVTLADDTWYIVDNNWILMLCEVIEQLQGMKRESKSEDALGVAYLCLRKFDDAERHLKAALDLTVTEEEKACALTNLSECCLYARG